MSCENSVENKVPIITLLFIVLNIILFYTLDTSNLLISPRELLSNPSLLNVGKGVLSNFLHVNFDHLFGNMAVMALTGFHVERKFGHKNMLYLMILALVGCSVFTLTGLAALPIPTLGASGIVSGIAAVFFLRY